VGTVGMARVDGEGRSAQATGCGTSAPVDHKQAVATMSTPGEQWPRAHLASSRSFHLSSDDHERATATTSELQPKRETGLNVDSSHTYLLKWLPIPNLRSPLEIR
jgi:hypothetical protein